MGNCLFGGSIVGVNKVIRVVTSKGCIMEFHAPVRVEFIADKFPGHSIFGSHDLFRKPLTSRELLQAGEYYLLRPLEEVGIIGPVRSNSVRQTSPKPPYRVSFDRQGVLKRSRRALFRCGNSEFWKVKVVISPQDLLEILSQESRTQELIENARTVGTCSNEVSATGFSDLSSMLFPRKRVA